MSCVVKRIDYFNSQVNVISNPDSSKDVMSSKSSVNEVRPTDRSGAETVTQKGESIQTSSTLTILKAVDESVRNLILFASRYVSTVAIPLGEFSVGCDVARFHLKLIEESTKKAEDDLIGRTESASNDAMMWVLRALSFAGLGTSDNISVFWDKLNALLCDLLQGSDSMVVLSYEKMCV